MADQNLENTVNSLKKEIESLKKECQNLKGVHEVQEVMSKYFYYLHGGHHKECFDELFAHKAPDVSAEIANWGMWEGPEALKNLYYKILKPKGAGEIYLHELDTPCIQVAGDGKTAKGVWFSPGFETPRVNGELKAMWCWSYYGADFIKEDGEWKIWHYHCYGMFKTPFEKSWVEYAKEMVSEGSRGPVMPEGIGPNKPTTYSNNYSLTSIRELVPAPPKPYETFDPSTRY